MRWVGGGGWVVFFFNDTATTEIYTLSLHDALPILALEADLRGISDVAGGPGGDPCIEFSATHHP